MTTFLNTASRKPRGMAISCLALMTTTVGLEMTLRTRMTCMASPPNARSARAVTGLARKPMKTCLFTVSNNDKGKLQVTRISVILFVFGTEKVYGTIIYLKFCLG